MVKAGNILRQSDVLNPYNRQTTMKSIRIKALIALSLMCLSASAQTEYSGIAGASPRLVRAHKKEMQKEARRNARANDVAEMPTARPSSGRSAKTGGTSRQTARTDSGEMEVRQGIKSVSHGVGQVVKREARTVGEITRKIGEGGKKFFRKLGKGISDSFKPDSTDRN